MGEIERLRILKERVLSTIEDEKLSEMVSKVCGDYLIRQLKRAESTGQQHQRKKYSVKLKMKSS